jgi:hypothetical protein
VLSRTWVAVTHSFSHLHTHPCPHHLCQLYHCPSPHSLPCCWCWVLCCWLLLLCFYLVCTNDNKVSLLRIWCEWEWK